MIILNDYVKEPKWMHYTLSWLSLIIIFPHNLIFDHTMTLANYYKHNEFLPLDCVHPINMSTTKKSGTWRNNIGKIKPACMYMHIICSSYVRQWTVHGWVVMLYILHINACFIRTHHQVLNLHGFHQLAIHVIYHSQKELYMQN